MKKVVFIYILFNLFVACNNESEKRGSEHKSETLPNTNLENIEVETHSEQIEIAWYDTVRFDTFFIPNETYENNMVLPIGVFHSDEVWDTAHQQRWFGLFNGVNGYYLSKTQIETNRVYDAIIDEEGETTAWEVKTLNSDSCFILINNNSFLDSGLVNRFLPNFSTVIPGDTNHFTFKENDYYLYATGGKLKVQENPDWYELWNYKLYLSSTKNGATVNQLLVAIPRFGDTMVEIEFMGDIDSDGLIDFIINTSDHYNAYSPTLYLSEPADSNSLLKIIGTHVSVGC